MSTTTLSSAIPSATSVPMAIAAHRLSIGGWLARTAALLAVFGIFSATATALLTRSEFGAGFPSWTVNCDTSAQSLTFWYSFSASLSNSFRTPNERHCKELLEGPQPDPRVGVAYSLSLFHRGARAEGLARLEEDASRGSTPAAHALASLYLDPAVARRLGVSDPVGRAIALLRKPAYQISADSHFLLFKALNLSQRADYAADAALSLLRSLSLGSHAAMLHLQTVPLGGERAHLQPATKKAIKSILRASHFTEATDDDFATIEDYVALVQFIVSRPEVREDDCIVANAKTICPQAWRWRLIDEIGKAKLENARSLDELAEIVVYAAKEVLTVPPSLRSPAILRKLKSSTALTYSIGALYVALRSDPTSEMIHECDRLTAHPYDPNRIGRAIDFEKIDALPAIAACDRAIAEHGASPRFLYQRGRAHSRTQQMAAEANDRESLRHSASLSKADFQAAAKLGYPIAFNNLAFDLGGSANESVLDDAASLYLQALNRTLHCCWPLIARTLLDDEQSPGMAERRTLVRTITAWSAALGNTDAALILESLGEPTPAPAGFSDTPYWLRGP